MSWVFPYVKYPRSILVNGMVFGDDTGMPKSINHSVKIIGMQHVMAASGFNVGLILSLTRLFLRRFCHPTVTAFFGLLAIGGYVALIGAPASAIRAGLMVGYVVLASRFFRRQVVAWYSLVVGAGLMLLVSWEYWESLSFQLSISATLGLILVEPRLSQIGANTWFGRQDGVGEAGSSLLPNPSSVLKETAITTIAAQAFTVPLLLYHFGELSTLSLVANVALLWLTPFITVGGIWLVILAGISHLVPWLTSLVYLWGLGLDGLSGLFLYLVAWLGRAQWSLWSLPFTFPLWAVLLWWLLLFVWLFFGNRHDQNR